MLKVYATHLPNSNAPCLLLAAHTRPLLRNPNARIHHPLHPFPDLGRVRLAFQSMITFLLLLWAIDSQDETNRLLRMTPAQRRAEERQEIAILVTVIIILLVAL